MPRVRCTITEYSPWSWCLQEAENFKKVAEELIATTPLLMFSKTYCSFCKKAQRAIRAHDGGQALQVIELDDVDVHHVFGHLLADGHLSSSGPNATIMAQMACQQITGSATVPQVFIGGTLVGGCDDTLKLDRSGRLKTLIAEAPSKVRSSKLGGVRVRADTCNTKPELDHLLAPPQSDSAEEGGSTDLVSPARDPWGTGEGAFVTGWMVAAAAMLGLTLALWLERRQTRSP